MGQLVMLRGACFAFRYGVGLVVCDRCGGAVLQSDVGAWGVVWPAQVTSLSPNDPQLCSGSSVPVRYSKVCPGCLSEDERVQLNQFLEDDLVRRARDAWLYGPGPWASNFYTDDDEPGSPA